MTPEDRANFSCAMRRAPASFRFQYHPWKPFMRAGLQRDLLDNVNAGVASVRGLFDEADREVRRAKLLQRPLQVVSQLWRRVEDWEDPRENAADKLLDLAQNALTFAAKTGRRDVVVEILRRYQHLELDVNSCVRISVAEGHTELLAALLTPGPSLDRFLRLFQFAFHRLSGQRTLLQCTEMGDAVALKALRDVGISFFDNTSLPRSRPLEAACYAGQPDAVAFILQDPNVVEYVKTGESNCIHFAARQGHVCVVKLLFETGGISLEHAPSEGDLYNLTPLQCAAISGSLDMCKLLLEQGADVNESRPGKKRALSIAASEGHLLIAALLLERGACLDASTPGTRDALDYVFSIQDDDDCELEMLKLFLRERPECKNLFLRSIINNWIVADDLLTAFLTAGADPNQRAPVTGITPLHVLTYYAVHVSNGWLYRQTIESIELLVKAGAKPGLETTGVASSQDFALGTTYADVPPGSTPLDIARTMGTFREANGAGVMAALGDMSGILAASVQ